MEKIERKTQIRLALGSGTDVKSLATFSSGPSNHHPPPIPLRPNREMHPIRALLRTLNKQFIKLLPRQIGIVSQNHPIPHGLYRISILL